MSALPSLQSAARALGGDIVSGQILAPGPGHSAKDRSMQVKLDPSAPDGILVRSFAGDDPLDCKDHVREKLGLEKWNFEQGAQQSIDNMRARAQIAPHARSKIVCQYVYKQADGTPYLRVQRMEPKGFPQSRWTGTGWAPGKPQGPMIPYRLPELVHATHTTVFIVEGEKDADRLASLGFVATTSSEGAGKWTADLNQFFRYRTVYILADNDLPGRKHAKQVAENLLGIAAEVRVVGLPGLPEKGDVSDWLDAGGDPDQLEIICRQFPAYVRAAGEPEVEEDVPFPEKEAEAPLIGAEPFVWCDPRTIPRRQWLYGQHFIRKFVSVTVAPGGVGKSSLELVEALAMASGRNLLECRPTGRYRVWYWCGEDPKDELQRRVMAAAMHHGVTAEEVDGNLFVNSGRSSPIVIAEQTRHGVTIAVPVVEAVKRTIRENEIDVVIIDPFVSSHQVAENDNGAIDRVVKVWAGIAEETGCAVELVHHVRKTGGTEITVEDGRGASALLAAARSARTLNVMTGEEAEKAGVEKRRLHFRVDNGKSNMAPPPDVTNWYRLASVDLGNGYAAGETAFDFNLGPSDHVGVVTTWKWPNPLDDINVSDLRAAQNAVAGGKWRKDAQADDWVGKAIAEALHLNLDNPAHKEKVKRLLGIWMEKGMFKVVMARDAKGNERPFVEVGEWAND